MRSREAPRGIRRALIDLDESQGAPHLIGQQRMARPQRLEDEGNGALAAFQLAEEFINLAPVPDPTAHPITRRRFRGAVEGGDARATIVTFDDQTSGDSSVLLWSR